MDCNIVSSLNAEVRKHLSPPATCRLKMRRKAQIKSRRNGVWVCIAGVLSDVIIGDFPTLVAFAVVAVQNIYVVSSTGCTQRGEVGRMWRAQHWES